MHIMLAAIFLFYFCGAVPLEGPNLLSDEGVETNMKLLGAMSSSECDWKQVLAKMPDLVQNRRHYKSLKKSP